MENNRLIFNSDTEMVERVRKSVTFEIEKRKAINAPVVKSDRKTGIIYREMPNGERIQVASNLRGERYSERIRKKT